MKTSLPLAFTAALLLASCASPKIDTQATVTPGTFQVGETNRIVVKAENRSKKPIEFMPSITRDGNTVFVSVLCGAGFVRDPDWIFAASREVSICPPHSHSLDPGESRDFTFILTPDEGDLGDGFLVIHMPPEFRRIAPLAINVSPAGDDGRGATVPHHRP